MSPKLLFAVGHIRPKGEAISIKKRIRVAFCGLCQADRALMGVAAWPGWDAQIVTGACCVCGKTVAVSSSRPPEAA